MASRATSAPPRFAAPFNRFYWRLNMAEYPVGPVSGALAYLFLRKLSERLEREKQTGARRDQAHLGRYTRGSSGRYEGLLRGLSQSHHRPKTYRAITRKAGNALGSSISAISSAGWVAPLCLSHRAQLWDRSSNSYDLCARFLILGQRCFLLQKPPRVGRGSAGEVPRPRSTRVGREGGPAPKAGG
jgi:hypothetical protein